MGHAEVVLQRLSKNFIDSQVSYVYEQICQDKLWELSAKGELPGILERVGRWWDGSHEIDVVGVSEEDNLLVLGGVNSGQVRSELIFSRSWSRNLLLSIGIKKRERSYTCCSVFMGFVKICRR